MVVDSITPVSVVKGFEWFTFYARTENSLLLDHRFGLDRIYPNLCAEDEEKALDCLALMKNPELGLRQDIILPIPQYVDSRFEQGLRNIESPSSRRVALDFAAMAMRIGYLPVLPMAELRCKINNDLNTAIAEGYLRSIYLNNYGTHQEFAEVTKQFTPDGADVDRIMVQTICQALI